MTTHAVTIPTEPRDRTVALDSEGHAWQRAGDAWWCVDRYEAAPGQLIGARQARRTWPHLIVDFGPLTELQPKIEATAWPTVPGEDGRPVTVPMPPRRPVRDNPQA